LRLYLSDIVNAIADQTIEAAKIGSLSRHRNIRKPLAFEYEAAPSTILDLYCEFANDCIVCIVSSVTGCTAATRMAYIRLQNTVEVSFNRARGRNSTAGNSLRHSDRGWSALKTGVEFNASHSSTQRRASPRTNGLTLQKIMQRAKMRLHFPSYSASFYFNWKINCDSLCSLHISPFIEIDYL